MGHVSIFLSEKETTIDVPEEKMVENICTVEDRIAWLDKFSTDVLRQEEERRKTLTLNVHRRMEAVLSALIFLFNLFLFTSFPLYVTGWIVCSLFLLAFYPLTTLIPSLVRVFKKKAKKQEKIISVQSRCLNYYEKVSSSTTSSGPFFLLISDQRLLPLSSSAVRMCLQPSVFFLW
jgi:hypothetical protein